MYIVYSNNNQYYILKIKDVIEEFTITEIDKVNDLIVYNNNIYLIGQLKNNLSIQIINEDLEKSNQLTFEGDGTQEGTCGLIYQNYIYVGGIKSAHTNNEYFKNVGNKGEIKSFVFKFDLDLNVIKQCYFNENEEKEELKSMIIYENKLSVLLSGSKEYIYVLNDNLELIEKDQVGDKLLTEVQTVKKNDCKHLMIKQKNKKTYLLYLDNNMLNVLYTINGVYLDYQYINGLVTIYYHYDEKTYSVTLSEYHIDYINNLECNYFDNDINKNHHYKVDSYFEDLTFSKDNISPYYTPLIDGTYQITYESETMSGQEIRFSTHLVVDPYVNIVDKGIYKTGSRLYYYGYGKLDGKDINNGYQLSEEGQHKLELTNVNGETKTYIINVVDDYYHDYMDVNLPTDYTLNFNDTLLLELNYESVVKSIYINNTIGKICLLNDKQYLEIPSSSVPGINFYTISKIEFTDGKYINVDNTFSVKTNKPNVSYAFYEYEENNIMNLDIDIDDQYQNIKDVYIKTTSSNQVIYQKSTYIKNVHESISLDKSQSNLFEVIVITSDNEEFCLFSYEGSGDQLVYSLDFVVEEDIIKSIHLELDLSTPELTHHKMYVGGTEVNSLADKYQVKKSNLILIISILLSIGLVIGLGTYFYIKRKNHKNSKSL